MTERRLAKASVAALRQENIAGRECALELMRTGSPAQAERFWRTHLERRRDLVLRAYPSPTAIDVLNEPFDSPRPMADVKRPVPAGAV